MLTILDKSRTYTSLLFFPLGAWVPPNSTTWWSSIMVKEKLEQGGGLVPLAGEEDHVPEGEETHTQTDRNIALSYIALLTV